MQHYREVFDRLVSQTDGDTYPDERTQESSSRTSVDR
jgi:hypothetical protein